MAIQNMTVSRVEPTKIYGLVCEYCGQPLQTVGVRIGDTIHNIACACDCEEARREYAPRPEKPITQADRYERAGIATEYQSPRVDCAEYVEAIEDGRNVFITGDNGSGKSTLAASVAMALIDQRVCVLFINAAIEAQRIRDGFSKGGSDGYDHMAEAPVLVIDDLGKGNPTEWDNSLWYSVAEERNAKRLPTVVTSNYDGGALIERLTVNGDDSTARAIVSRLRGGALTVKMQGKDMRLRK